MSADIDADVLRSLQAASDSYGFFNAGVQAYQAHITRFDWAAAEEERLKAHVALDDYFDHFGAAQKRVQQAKAEQTRSGGPPAPMKGP